MLQLVLQIWEIKKKGRSIDGPDARIKARIIFWWEQKVTHANVQSCYSIYIWIGHVLMCAKVSSLLRLFGNQVRKPPEVHCSGLPASPLSRTCSLLQLKRFIFSRVCWTVDVIHNRRLIWLISRKWGLRWKCLFPIFPGSVVFCPSGIKKEHPWKIGHESNTNWESKHTSFLNNDTFF